MTRDELLNDFIANNVANVKEVVSKQPDASFRSYSRVITDTGSFIVMNSPPDKEPIDDFIKVCNHLIENGFTAPKIHAMDKENGFLLLQDFGDDTVSNLLKNGTDAKPLYEMAIDTLVELHKSPFITAINVNPYDAPTYMREVELLKDWFIPFVFGEMSVKQQADFKHAWLNVITELPMVRSTLVLRDYHVDNIMMVDGKCGLLDFQDALIGNPAYDVASLLQDVRIDVDDEKYYYNRYKEKMNSGESFDKSYDILCAQRHAKVLGIFIRLYQRDNKPSYLKFLPRTLMLFKQSLNSPHLTAIKKYFDENYPDFFEKSQDSINKLL
ncbi:MAG: aminoglycoside phosphotransferase family protein [Alphaproteobacteria bacterium]